MKLKFIKPALNLLMDEWNLGAKESGAPKNLCALIYLFELIEKSEYFIYYTENNRLYGFASYSKKNSKKHIVRKKLASLIRKILLKSKKIKDLAAFEKYNNSYDYIPDNLKNTFDGEILILILDKSLRGKGLVKNLLLETYKEARKNNIKNLYILTDDSCTYDIYENTGCKKIFETSISTTEYGTSKIATDECAYIYEKRLDNEN